MLESLFIDDLQLHETDTSIIKQRSKGFGSPPPRPVVRALAERHGVIDDTDLYGPRRFELVGGLFGADSAATWQLFDDLKERLALGSQHVLRFRRKGRSEDERCIVKVASEVGDRIGYGWLEWDVDLLAADPRVYSAALKSGSYDPTDALTGGGVSFPLAFPLTFSTTTASHLVLLNAGNFKTPPVLTIDGPVANPFLDNDTIGDSIAIANVLGANDRIIVDVAARTVTLNGADRRDLISVSQTRWWELIKGTNRIRLRGTGMSAGQTLLTCQYRDARI